MGTQRLHILGMVVDWDLTIRSNSLGDWNSEPVNGRIFSLKLLEQLNVFLAFGMDLTWLDEDASVENFAVRIELVNRPKSFIARIKFVILALDKRIV